MAVAESAQPGTLRVAPTLEQARELAGSYNLIPLSVSFVDDCETPVSAFLKLRALAPSQPAFLLESAEQGQRVGRWSFIGFTPHEVVRWSLADGGDPYALAAARLARFVQAPPADAASAPPFTGGAVGVFGYDLVRTVEPLGEPNPDPVGVPDMALMLTDGLVVFDHLKHTITILVNANLEAHTDVERAYGDAVAQIAQVREALAGPVPREDPRAPREMPAFASNMPREEFEAMVARVIEYIYAGDAFQVVPSQRWSAPSPVEAFSIYRGLRAVNPSPYMYFLDFGDFQVAGASPEPLLTVTGTQVSTKPIAGTRPRGASPEEDRRIAAELLADEKERAEHVMLVDLGRNDLGRVCEYGTVKVDELMEVETYSHVMHIVSSVSGNAASRRRRDGRAALGAAGRHALRRAEGARDADHRRARAGEARRLRRRRRLPLIRRRPRHRDPHPHGRRQGRRRARAGRRRHRRRRAPGLRVRGVGREDERGDARDRARVRAARLALSRGCDDLVSLANLRARTPFQQSVGTKRREGRRWG